MNRIFNKLIIGLLMVSFSCKQTKDNSNQSIAVLPDSLQLSMALGKAEQLAHQNIHLSHFRDTMEKVSNGNFTLTTTVLIDSFFNTKCLRIYRKTPEWTYTDLYLKKENDFNKVLTLENHWTMTGTDTIYDVNGDEKEDYLVNWYGPNGCCLRNFYDVYLLKNDGSFSEKYTFINPTFYPREKMIRGVEYGHPGQTDLYKYKWSGLVVDTIEYISHDRNENGEYLKGEYLKSTYLPSGKRNHEKVNTKLKVVPNEYKDIYGYDWFLGEFN